MQVKKFTASTVLEALKLVKEDLGPEAIILSTQEGKRLLSGQRQFIVVAAISENQLRKKQLAEKTLGRVFEEKVKQRPARQQKQVIESVYDRLEEKMTEKRKQFTSTPYFQIQDEEDGVVEKPPVQTVSSAPRSAVAAPVKSVANPQMPHLEIPNYIKEMKEKLKRCGIDSQILEQWVEQAQDTLGVEVVKKSAVEAWFAKRIMATVQINQQVDDAIIEVFVGPQGSGKTTALVKFAAFLSVQRGKKVAIITTDHRKVGALEQIRTFCRILNLPFFAVRNTTELSDTISSLSSYDKILIDTPGVSLSNMEDLNFIRPFAALKKQVSAKVHFVVSALTKTTDLAGLLKRFRVADFDDVILTNLDQTTQHGIIINTQLRTEKPFHSFGIGADIIDGFEMATRERVLDLIFRLTKKSGEREHDSGLS